jgi:RHS repeat-associated protein
VLWEGAWTAWGQPNCASAPPSAFGYHGQTGAYLDAESGLLKMGARYYAPCIGRFLTRDPSGYSAGGNLYAFCMGDPVNFFDPNGCDPFPYASELKDALSRARDGISQEVGRPHGPTAHALLDACNAGTKAGTAQGRFDSGKISAGELAMAYGEYGLALADAALTIVDGVKTALPCHLGGTYCFVAGTPVWVAEQDKSGQWHVRSKPIEQVKAGEYVIARNETSGVPDH